MHIIKSVILGFSIFSLLCAEATAYEKPERRRDQYPTDIGYLFLPLPYSYPGIGDGVILLVNASNLFETTTDGFFMEITGDAKGRLGHLSELPLIKDKLFLSIDYQDIDSAVVNNYESRGMGDTNKDDYSLLEVNKADSTEINLKYSSQERRYSVFISHATEDFSLTAIRDSNGDIITVLDEPYTSKSKSNVIGFNLDYTDDYLDPLKGMKLSFTIRDNPAEGENDPGYFTTDFSYLYYKPMRDSDTLVFNYYQSDAHVQKTGNTNVTDIQNEVGLNCDASDSDCLKTQQEIVTLFINQRTNGTASSLGGLERLRSYPQGRFQGGHTAFVGAEYRWNMTAEATPFNYLFWKDVRTGKQIAIFAEAGSVSEKASDLWREQEYSVGVGYRLLSASGSVYRADIAYGGEGVEMAIFFEYPWN